MDRLSALERRVSDLEALLAGLSVEQRELGRERPIAAIVADAAAALDVGSRAIVSEQRDPVLYRARFAVAWTAREAHGCTYARIGRAIGRLDHTSVRHQFRRAEQLRREDEAFRLLTDRLLAAAEERRAAR